MRLLALFALAAFTCSAIAQHGASASNMTLVGHEELQGRSAYQPILHQQGGRWIAYIGHHGGKAMNPLTGSRRTTAPRSSTSRIRGAALPGAHSGGAGRWRGRRAQMVRACNGADLPKADKSKVYLLRSFGKQAHEIWDVTNPQKPSRVTVVVDKLRDTHKSWWECDTGIAYIVSGVEAGARGA
jgi:hypothetical protein